MARKKSAKKQAVAQKTSKYVIPEPSPVATCSKSVRSEELAADAAKIDPMPNEKGLRSFGKIDPAIIFKFLTYDGTVAAERAKRAAGNNQRSGQGRSGVMYSCYAHNYNAEGCKGNCGYRHICSSCGSQSHVYGDCQSQKPSSGHPKHK